MNENHLQINDNHQQQAERESLISDLPVTEGQQDQVKGGPIYMRYEGIKGSVTAAGFEKGIQ